MSQEHRASVGLVAGSTRGGNGEMLVAHVKRAATFSANFSAVTAESGIKSTLDILNFFSMKIYATARDTCRNSII